MISCGFVSTLVGANGRSPLHCALGYAHPLPERALVSFLKNLDRVLVVEEIAPIVEESVNALVARHGLKTKRAILPALAYNAHYEREDRKLAR